MKNLILYSAIVLASAVGVSTADAKPKHHDRGHHYGHSDRHDRHDRHDHDRYDDHYHHRHSTRTIYFIERGRPVRRVVYVHPSGYYYRVVGGRPVRIRERYFTSYPSRYFYPDGRRRVGVSISF